MIVRYGVAVERGFMPVFSVPTEQDAEDLLMFACPTNIKGEYVAPELAREQTLENLDAFGDRLAEAWEAIQRARAERSRTV